MYGLEPYAPLASPDPHSKKIEKYNNLKTI